MTNVTSALPPYASARQPHYQNNHHDGAPTNMIPLSDVARNFPAHVSAMTTIMHALSRDVDHAGALVGPTTGMQATRRCVARIVQSVANFLWGVPMQTTGQYASVSMSVCAETYGSFATATALDVSNLNITLCSVSGEYLTQEYLHQLQGFLLGNLGPLITVSLHDNIVPQRVVLEFNVSLEQMESIAAVLNTGCTASSPQAPHFLRRLHHVVSIIQEQQQSLPSAPPRRRMESLVTLNQHRGLDHVGYFNHFVTTYPEFQSFFVLLRAHCSDLQVPQEQMTSTVLMWTAVAYFRYHIARLGTNHSSPGQAFLGFLEFFRTGGGFDPRLFCLCPGHSLGILPRPFPSKLSMWIVVDPLTMANATGAGRGLCMDQHLEQLVMRCVDDSSERLLGSCNVASSCYMVYVFRHSLHVLLQKLLSDYCSVIVRGATFLVGDALAESQQCGDGDHEDDAQKRASPAAPTSSHHQVLGQPANRRGTVPRNLEHLIEIVLPRTASDVLPSRSPPTNDRQQHTTTELRQLW